MWIMKLRSCQNMSVLGFVDPEILLVFCDHQLINGLIDSVKKNLQWTELE